MRLIGLAVILSLSLTLAPLAADGQEPGKVPRIGFLVVSTRSFVSTRIETFRQGLRELGYVEGKNVLIEYRYAEGKLGLLPALASELVQRLT
jgi:putative ABC transport system substrate-binding protein